MSTIRKDDESNKVTVSIGELINDQGPFFLFERLYIIIITSCRTKLCITVILLPVSLSVMFVGVSAISLFRSMFSSALLKSILF